jgi:hypothetical protein
VCANAGFIQLKSGSCDSDESLSSCGYTLRADGGLTTFDSSSTGGAQEFHNGKYTIAKSRHPHVKITMKELLGGTHNAYVHLY